MAGGVVRTVMDNIEAGGSMASDAAGSSSHKHVRRSLRQTARLVARRLYRELVPLVYGRSNYKLFLQRSLETLDRRAAAILCSTNVLPGMLRAVPVQAPFGRSMLVVAPHQDDEIIGCGGAMLLHKAAGGDLHVIFTQDGGDEHAEDGRSRQEQLELREAEARAVAQAMEIPDPRFLRSVQLIGEDEERLVEALANEIIRVRADTVFTPFFLDYNYHHQLTNYLLAEALDRTRRSITVYCYEVWGLTVPNVILNIDAVAEVKRDLLRLYTSQLSGKDYVHAVAGRDMYHSIHFGSGECRFAERFFEMPASEFVKTVRSIRDATSVTDVPQPY